MSDQGGKRIAVIGLSYPFRGGIAHYSTLLVRALRERHTVRFLTLSRQYPEILFPGKTQYDVSSRPLVETNEPIIDSINPLSWYRTAALLNRESPDLIIFQWWHPFFGPVFGLITRFLRPVLREKICFLCHNVLPHESSPLQRVLTQYAFRHAKFFVVHSEQDERQLATLQKGGLVTRGCHPTYAEFSQHESYTKDEACEALSIPKDRRTILFFGLVRRYKGLQFLIDAMQQVISRVPCHLLIAGEFYDDKQPYVERIQERGLNEHITVIDQYIPNEQLALYFASADLVALPYVSATQSGIIQIAFGFGVPVITTSVGGLPEAVDHGKTGLIVEPNNAEQLAEGIIEYFERGYEDSFRQEIQRQGSRFDWSQELRHLDDFLARAA